MWGDGGRRAASWLARCAVPARGASAVAFGCCVQPQVAGLSDGAVSLGVRGAAGRRVCWQALEELDLTSCDDDAGAHLMGAPMGGVRVVCRARCGRAPHNAPQVASGNARGARTPSS